VLWRTLLFLVVLLLVVRFVLRLTRGIMQGAGAVQAGPGRASAKPAAVKMVRDPVCGTYVVPGRALELPRGRETVYFCSKQCRDQWAEHR
jgi:YHS domain-containing protein